MLWAVCPRICSSAVCHLVKRAQEIRSLQSAEMSGYLFHAGIGGGPIYWKPSASYPRRWTSCISRAERFSIPPSLAASHRAFKNPGFGEQDVRFPL